MMVSVRGLYFLVTLFLGSFFGSIFMLGPVLPLMLLSPAWYRWITDRVVATWLTLPVVWHTPFTHFCQPNPFAPEKLYEGGCLSICEII